MMTLLEFYVCCQYDYTFMLCFPRAGKLDAGNVHLAGYCCFTDGCSADHFSLFPLHCRNIFSIWNSNSELSIMRGKTLYSLYSKGRISQIRTLQAWLGGPIMPHQGHEKWKNCTSWKV